MNQKSRKLLKVGSAGFCLLAMLVANQAKAQTQYLEPVINGGTYSWDNPIWTANGAANASPYTSSWVAGNFARFYNGTGDTYTVTVNAAESMSGLYLNSGSATTLSINDAGGGTGSLSVVAGSSQASQNGFSWVTQGFLTGGGTLNLNAPITGTGGVEEESGGGNINLYGVNTFTGGFLATSSSTFIGFNNNASFGAPTSQIGFDGTTFAIMNNTGPTTVNIPNPVQTIGATGVNFIGNSSTMSGNWYLGGGSSAINLRNNGTGGATVTLSGNLSGTSGAITFSGANGGNFVLSGAANTYTGLTTIGSSGDTSITVEAGVANALGTTSGLSLAGGTFNAGGFNQAINGKLSLSVNSSLMFGATSGTAISFANSSSATWTSGKILNLADWQGNSVADGGSSTDTLEFGTDATGLSAAQLADIEFDGAGLGTAAIDANGFIYQTPEPSTIALGVIGAMTFLGRMRRRS